MQAITRNEQWFEAILEELKSIKSALSELVALLKSERKPNEKPIS